jgi:hypothetical protein
MAESKADDYIIEIGRHFCLFGYLSHQIANFKYLSFPIFRKDASKSKQMTFHFFHIVGGLTTKK